MTLRLRAKALDALNKTTCVVIDYSQVAALHGCHDLAWVALSTLKSGDPLWVRNLFRALRTLARNLNVMTRGAASSKSILLAYGKHIRNDLVC